MADTGTAQSPNTWPLVKFAFSVKIGDIIGLFQEVSGLNAETQQIEYRQANNSLFSTMKMSGIKKFGNITLKKGLFRDDKALWDLYNLVKMNTFEPKTITISLLDEAHGIAMSWTLLNSFPVKITVTDMKVDANDAAVESIKLVHEGLQII